jgi:hypothetical protein
MATFFCTVIEQRGMSDRRTTVSVESSRIKNNAH